MWQDLKVDCVAPPFAGHLFPLLDLAGGLRLRGVANLRFLSTAGASEAIRLSGFPFVELLPGSADAIRDIVDPGKRVGFHPLRLYAQFRKNMALMVRLRDDLRKTWADHRPDLVVADFAVPFAGLLARSMGIPWWTSLPTPCALETRTGTPSYLGGWTPRNDLLGHLRDGAGRTLIHTFKLALGVLFRRQFRELGIPGVYREDGCEIAYSPECILGLGMREFEFERDWPDSFHFVGPLTASPPFAHAAPVFEPGRRHVLLSLGTHLPWARKRATDLAEAVARLMPDCVFHFAQGRPGDTSALQRGNLHLYGFVPYDSYLARYDAAVIHGGTGVTYSCLRAGVPMLVWPHDYDQHDHAARLVARGLGLRLRTSAGLVRQDLEFLFHDEKTRANVRTFQTLASNYNAHDWVASALEGLTRPAPAAS